MNSEKLKQILNDHVAWLENSGGERAYLSGANLSRANLSRANLSGANLSDADLSGANLSDADLSGANLSGANLFRAYLSGANLFRANLSGAYLSGANLSDADLPFFQICHGTLNVWKAGENGHIINLKIPAKAKRTAALTGRKCRAQYATVLAIYDADGTAVKSCGGWHQKDFIYGVGKTVKPDEYDDDIRVECSHGIHFFLTREEAEAWA